ncbi:MAG TPA: pyruvate kinase [Amycolatopsis sp.]
MPRETKIVATLGPASSTPEILTRLIAAGVDVVRMNFSHGTAQDHIDRAKVVREVAAGLGREVAIMADLQGPKIRVGRFAEGKINLTEGDRFTLDAACELGNQEQVGLDYKELPHDVRPGDVLLLNDGLIKLEVVSVKGTAILTRVVIGGILSNNKGINRQGGGLTASALTAKDMDDIRTAVQLGADYVAVSFPKAGEDMYTARQLLRASGGTALLIAKIERAEAITNLADILNTSDGIMVARGDLAVEVGNARIPGLQKKMIRMALEANKLTITATQMMESMIQNPVPTRAEVSDVANAVLDGTDAVMLSGETSVGRYPIETVQTMGRIVEAVETDSPVVPPLTHVPRTKRGVISYAARDIGERLNAKALVAFTQSGDTVRRLARLHTRLPLLAFTPEECVRSQLSMTWGTNTQIVPRVESTDQMIQQVDHKMLEMGKYQRGDLVVIVAGSPPGTVGSTNLIHVHRLGEDDHA